MWLQKREYGYPVSTFIFFNYNIHDKILNSRFINKRLILQSRSINFHIIIDQHYSTLYPDSMKGQLPMRNVNYFESYWKGYWFSGKFQRTHDKLPSHPHRHFKSGFRDSFRHNAAYPYHDSSTKRPFTSWDKRP